MGGRKIRSQKERWFKEHPFCYWCGCELVLAPRGAGGGGPPNTATIDHLRMRGDPTRREPNRFRLPRRVLACLRCNSARPNPFVKIKLMALEDKWRVAGHWPRMAYQCGALPGEVG